jgi:uncharacterized RDD family membrane protein YckC
MSSAAETLDLAVHSFQMENTSEFSPERLKAPFLLRCAAAFIDYMLLVAVPVLWLLLSNVIGDGPASVSLNTTVWLLVVIVWLADFLALPLFRGQTLGKMVAGITIVKTDGRPVRLGGIVLRNIVGYALTLITLGIGFLISAVNSSGRSLHDYLAGTVVVHGRKNVS